MDPFETKRLDFTRRREEFDERIEMWNRQPGVGSDTDSRASLASRWQQWAVAGGLVKVATIVSVHKADRKRQGNWWWNKGSPPRQATVSLWRGDTTMNEMFKRSQTHPLLVVDSKADVTVN